MKSEKLLSKPLCIGLLVFAFVYGLALPFFWGNNPAAEDGTISLLCEDHRLAFWLWGLSTAGSIILSTQYMFKRYNYKNKFFDALCALCFISMCGVGITLGHSTDSWNPKRIAHWVATGLFIAFIAAPIMLFFITNIKKYKHFPALLLCSLLILGTFAVIFAVFGKSALMEIIPIAMIEIFLLVINFTPLVKVELKEKKEKIAK